jgi:uncharacterized protein (DUF2147 family)
MCRGIWSFIVALLLLSPVQLTLAQKAGVPGYWKTVDDKTGELKSIVRLWEEGGKLRGRVVKVYKDPNRICDKCSGRLHNRPYIGLDFLWGFVRDKDDPNKWVDGEIVDPKDGSQYHCQLELTDGGKKLEVFGFIRVLFKIGRTQVWLRASPSDVGPVRPAASPSQPPTAKGSSAPGPKPPAK